jgi:hypothetical protein
VNAQFITKLTNFFEHEIGHVHDSAHYHTKYVFAPIVSYEPSTSLAFGLGTKLLFKFPKSYKETRTSNIPISARYTLKNQFIFLTDFTIFSNQEKWMFKGKIAALKYPAPFFGIGNRTRKEDEIILAYNQLIYEPLILKKVWKKLFVGGGVRLNEIYDATIKLEDGEEIHAEDSIGQRANGLELAISYDSRSNVLNSSDGQFIEYTLGTYEESLGSSHSFHLSKLNARSYHQFFPYRPKDTWAFELYSSFAWGDVPLLEYSTLGGQERLRGAQEGRYRDLNSLYFQTEYRWQTFERIGFVFYAGVGDVYDKLSDLALPVLKYNAGTGLRLKIVKEENLNIRFDYGFTFGHEFNTAFYLNIAEAF